MAVNISNTKYYKKGEKLPDGTTAKRNIVWDTKNNRRVTGTVTATTAAGVAAKRYKGGRSVTALKRAEAKKKASSGSSRTTTTTGKNPPPSMSAAEKARALRLKQNKGVKAGTVKMGAGGKVMRKYNAKTGRWEVYSGTSRLLSDTPRSNGGKPGGVPARGTGGAGRGATGNKPASTPATPARNPYSIRGQLESIAKLYGYSDAWVQRTEAQGATAARAVISNLYKKVVEGR